MLPKIRTQAMSITLGFRGLLMILTAACGWVILSSTFVLADQPHHYILLEEGNERSYCRNWTGALDFHTLITEVSGGISYQENTINFFDPPEVTTRYFTMNEEGDVWELPDLDAPQENWELILDMPLTPGKTWGTTWGEFDQFYTRYTVCAPEIVYTIFGELTAIPVDYEMYNGDMENGRTWYADGYGKVGWIYSCFSCDWSVCEATIGVDVITLGGVKALYR